MKKWTVSAIGFLIFIVISTNALATQIIHDYLDFGYYGIINDTDDNLDAVIKYSGNYVNWIEFSTSNIDTLQWYQSFTAPSDFKFSDVIKVEFHIYLRDDNDSFSEYGWFWSEDSPSWVNIDNYDIDTKYYDFDVDISALDGYGVYASISNTSSISYQSDFFVDRSVLHIEYVPAPEPSTFILLTLGLGGVLFNRLRKK